MRRLPRLPRLSRLLVLLAAIGAPLASPPAPAQPAPFVIATHQPPDNFQGRWVRLIYAEAFRRLGVPLQVAIYPLQRMTDMVDRGELDGDVGRVHAHGQAHPSLVRVEEPMYEIVFGLYAVKDAPRLNRIEDLAGGNWRAVYLRGVAICENLLKPYVAPEQLIALTTEEQGMVMLQLGRTDLYCSANHTMDDMAARPRFRDAKPLRMALSPGAIPLYPYLHRRHAELAPRLAAALRQMRAEGLIERYRDEALAASRE